MSDFAKFSESFHSFNEDDFFARCDWQVTVPGKWILAGEHAVLRGSEALVFPLKNCFLKIGYIQSDESFKVSITGQNSSDLEMIIWSVLEKALQFLNSSVTQVKGQLLIHSEIRFGAGMGASATLAVALTQFLKYLQFSVADDFVFAKKIEDVFHGESSGVDVAVALYQKPLLFKKNEPIQILENVNLPLMYLSYSGSRGMTKDCILQVKKLWAEDQLKAQLIDEDMKAVVQTLKQKDLNLSLQDWATQLTKAHSCFERWGLVSESVLLHTHDLKKQGALAVKLTGSGLGGYVLSLWPQKPSEETLKILDLIPVQ